MNTKYEALLFRISRYTGILFLPLLLIFFISGYGLVNTEKVYSLSGGLLDRGTAYTIHSNIAFPTLIVFILHSCLSIRTFLKRRYPGRNFDKLLAVSFTFLSVLMAYMAVG